MKNIYIGFAIDMDGAYHNRINTDGNIIPENHPSYKKYTKDMNVFLTGMNNLFNYFDKYNCQNAATWFVNEGFNISNNFPELLDKCAKLGEIGLHTHFDDRKLGGQGRYISKNIEDYYEKGLKKPTKILKEIASKYNKKMISFKAGCHLRNDDMFELLGELKYIYDTTMVYEDKLVDPDGNIRFDDSKLMFGTLPFYIITKNGDRILEIPEIRPGLHNVIKHINNTPDNAPVFIRLQVHPWDTVKNNHLERFSEIINYCKKNGNMKFKNIEEMGNIFLDYKIKKLSDKFLNEYKYLWKDDSYYQCQSRKNIFFQNSEIYIIKYLFNNFNNINIKILDCFAGIGQAGILLSYLGYKNIIIFDSSNDRLNIGNIISNKLKLNIKFITDDFFKKNKNLFNNDIIFNTNSAFKALDYKHNEQIEIYNKILQNDCILIYDLLRYGSKRNGNKICDKLNYNKKYLDLNYIQISNKIEEKDKLLSNFFIKYNLINNLNIEDLILNEKEKDFLSVSLYFKENISSSAGLFFQFPISFMAKYNFNLPIEKYKLTFYAKTNKYYPDFRFKIYTGIKYEVIDKVITTKYEEYSIETMFNFNTRSTYRIGFVNPSINMNIIVNNPSIKILI